MTVREAIHVRHSVRAYKELPLADETVKVLVDKITELNQEGRKAYAACPDTWAEHLPGWLYKDGFKHCQVSL